MSSLPIQKLPLSKKTKEWKENTVDYYERLSYTAIDGKRSQNSRKLTNYDLFNGKFNRKDLEYVCNPLGLKDQEFPATLQHYDIISPAILLLLGEETNRPDNTRIVNEAGDSFNKKTEQYKNDILRSLENKLMSQIDPSSIDPNNPPPTPQEVVKYQRYSYQDIIESQANKLLKILKKELNTKLLFSRGMKDVFIAGEEIYWIGIINNQVALRRCNPANMNIILDGDSDFIDDAIAVTETRMLSIPTILDEYGADLTNDQLTKLEEYSRSYSPNSFNKNNTLFLNTDQDPGVDLATNANFTAKDGYNAYMQNGNLRVVKVEWISMKKYGTWFHIDPETGIEEQTLVDEQFKLSEEDILNGDKVTWEWMNEAWEGTKIGPDIYVGIQAKPNQRKKLEDPYYAKLGYSGLIYNATNSISVSLIDRLKPYQYLYNILMYRLELAFASDMGKIMLMDLAQVPRSEGIDIDQWMYYLKATKIAFINSHEEGKRGPRTGMVSAFNQFQSIDMTLANTIQQYINSLDFIRTQIAYLSGVSPQRLGAIATKELVGNVERSIEQSSLITEVWFDSHDEVKRRVYNALIECAKIAYRDGIKKQYVTDDLGLELLEFQAGDLENSDLCVYTSNSKKDIEIIQSLKSLFQTALTADKANLSDIAKVLKTDSIADITHQLEDAEDKRAQQASEQYRVQQETEQQRMALEERRHQDELAEKQKDRDLKQYETDANNATKIQVQEIANYFKAADTDVDGDGIPDPIEIADQALRQHEVNSKNFIEGQKIKHDKEKHSKELSLKEKEIKSKESIEKLKIKQTEIQNKSQEKLAKQKAELDKEMMQKKLAIEKIKARKKPSSK